MSQASLDHREPCRLPTAKSTASFWHSQPSPLLLGHRSTRELPTTADVVVVGSGMAGAGAVHHLLNSEDGQGAKLDVVMLEAREACWGATGRNGGHCQPLLFEHPDDPSIGQFELKNFHTIRDLIKAKNIDCEFVTQPSVRSIYSHRRLSEVKLALSRVKEISPEQASMVRLVTDRDELSSLRVPKALAAVVTSLAARMWPYKFVTRILEDLVTSTTLHGSFNLQTLTPVTKIHRQNTSGKVVVETDRGSIAAKKVILTTNAYTSYLLHEFADLIVPCRGQMSALVPFPSIAEENRLKTSMGFMGDGIDDYLIQRPNERGGHLMFGGGRQKGPSIGLADDSVIDEDISNYLRTHLVKTLDLPEGRESINEALPTKARAMTATHIWTGVMGFSRDEKPWVGLVPETNNVYMAAGFTGHGMPNTWLSGKTVALIVKRTFAGADEHLAMNTASVETGLPDTYRTSKERMERAMRLASVEAVDKAEMELAQAAERPPSGYA